MSAVEFYTEAIKTLHFIAIGLGVHCFILTLFFIVALWQSRRW